jgi:hypothetical protein
VFATIPPPRPRSDVARKAPNEAGHSADGRCPPSTGRFRRENEGRAGGDRVRRPSSIRRMPSSGLAQSPSDARWRRAHWRNRTINEQMSMCRSACRPNNRCAPMSLAIESCNLDDVWRSGGRDPTSAGHGQSVEAFHPVNASMRRPSRRRCDPTHSFRSRDRPHAPGGAAYDRATHRRRQRLRFRHSCCLIVGEATNFTASPVGAWRPLRQPADRSGVLVACDRRRPRWSAYRCAPSSVVA